MKDRLNILKIQVDQKLVPFERHLADHGVSALRAERVSTLQVNLGKRCNQACHHCHVDAGPHRTEEMTRETVDLVLDVLQSSSIETLDITGGAPEINTHFRYLAGEGKKLCSRVIDRSNLTIFFEPGYENLPEFLADNRIDIIASLPCYLEENVDRQRGLGVFDRSIKALQQLNALGYGKTGTDLILNLVYNPTGSDLPPPQQQLQTDYKRELRHRYGVVFNELFTITNMPISRFRHDLERNGQLAHYTEQLIHAFNPATLEGLMCRHMVSVSWDGQLYDCDFNQMLNMPVNHGVPNHIRHFDRFLLQTRLIRTNSHCFGCTAGAGSTCRGAVIR